MQRSAVPNIIVLALIARSKCSDIDDDADERTRIILRTLGASAVHYGELDTTMLAKVPSTTMAPSLAAIPGWARNFLTKEERRKVQEHGLSEYEKETKKDASQPVHKIEFLTKADRHLLQEGHHDDTTTMAPKLRAIPSWARIFLTQEERRIVQEFSDQSLALKTTTTMAPMLAELPVWARAFLTQRERQLVQAYKPPTLTPHGVEVDSLEPAALEAAGAGVVEPLDPAASEAPETVARVTAQATETSEIVDPLENADAAEGLHLPFDGHDEGTLENAQSAASYAASAGEIVHGSVAQAAEVPESTVPKLVEAFHQPSAPSAGTTENAKSAASYAAALGIIHGSVVQAAQVPESTIPKPLETLHHPPAPSAGTATNAMSPASYAATLGIVHGSAAQPTEVSETHEDAEDAEMSSTGEKT